MIKIKLTPVYASYNISCMESGGIKKLHIAVDLFQHGCVIIKIHLMADHHLTYEPHFISIYNFISAVPSIEMIWYFYAVCLQYTGSEL